VGVTNRLPGEPNPIVVCACGCGSRLRKFDKGGRPREFVSGHNPQAAPTESLILDALRDGPRNLRHLADLHGNLQAVKGACSKLTKRGRIVRLGRGIYGRPDEN
jgi:hypothetical protein